jgi:hypothetical protein
MRANELDIDGAKLIRNRHNKTVIIAFDIEYYAPIFKDAGATLFLLNVRRLIPIRLFDLIHPSL